MRLIDADAFFDDFPDLRDYEYASQEYEVDAEPAVRCKDCKYMIEDYDTDGNVPYWICSEWDRGTDFDGYCHYGEQKNKVGNE